jgi:hypothetical protein
MARVRCLLVQSEASLSFRALSQAVKARVQALLMAHLCTLLTLLCLPCQVARNVSEGHLQPQSSPYPYPVLTVVAYTLCPLLPNRIAIAWTLLLHDL